MKKILIINLILIFVVIELFAQQVINPETQFSTKGLPKDFVVEGEYVYIATNKGVIQILNLKTAELIREIELPTIQNVDKKKVKPVIFSIDKIPNEEFYLITCQGDNGKTYTYIYRFGFWNKIENLENYTIRKALFIDTHTIILVLLSNEIIKYNIFIDFTIFKKQITESTFSDFSLSEDKSNIAIADEGGVVSIVDLFTGRVIERHEDENVDKVFQLDYKNNKILTGGQDRRIAFYDRNIENSYHIQKDFLMYSVSLNSQATIASCQTNENCDIAIFSTISKLDKFILKGHNGLINKMFFISNNEIISIAEDEKLIYWKF